MFSYKGKMISLSMPHSPQLKTALSKTYNQEITPILLRVCLTRFKPLHSIMWNDVMEIDDVLNKEVFPNLIGEYILPCLSAASFSRVGAYLSPEEFTLINLQRAIEFQFEVSDLDLPTKTRKDGVTLRDKSPECGGRILYRLEDSKLTGFTYL